MPSLPITDAGAQQDRAGHLLDLLATVPDPRDPRGVRYPLAGVLAGARSFAAIGEWAADLPGAHRARIGLVRAPEESTLRKLFARLDTNQLDQALGAWLWTRSDVVDGQRVIALDGKTVRPARSRTDAAPAAPHPQRRTWSPRSSTPPRPCSGRSPSPRGAMKSLPYQTCSRAWT